MGVVTGIVRRAAVPHEDAWMDLRMLSWLQLDEARRKRLAAIGEQAKAFAGLRDLVMTNDAPAPEAVDPLSSYDQLTLLRHGIGAWSYGQTVEPELLDERTAEWAAREVLALTLPSEDDLGKGSSRSTDTRAAQAAERQTSG